MDESLALKFLPDEVKEKLEDLIHNDLQFVKIPKEILCISCGCIPLFHYIYPCLHPYCRDCFKNKFQKYKMKCKKCKGELGTRLLQRTSIEYDIYMLKAICPNKRYGCKDVIALNCLLEHIEVCQFTEENQQNDLELRENVSPGGSGLNIDMATSADLRDLKILILEMKVKMEDFNKSNTSSDKLVQLVIEENERLKEQMRQTTLDLKRMQDFNEATNNKMNQICDKLKLIKIKSRQKDSNVEINVESLKLPTTLQIHSKSNAEVKEPLVPETNIPPQAMAPEVIEERFRKLENIISDVSLSQMAIRNNVEQYIRVIVAAQLLPEDEPVIRETISKKIEGVSVATIESDLGKMIVDNQLDFKNEIHLIKKIIQNNNVVIESQSNTFKSICDLNIDTVEEFKMQKVINENFERKLFEIYWIKGRMNKLENTREIKELVMRSPWNYLNFDHQEEIKNKIEEIRSLKNGTVLLKIENYDKNKKEASTVSSEPFFIGENGFKMIIKIGFIYEFIKPSIELLPEEFDHSISPLIHFRATLSILDQSKKNKKRDRVTVYEPYFGEDVKKVLETNYFYWQILSATEEKEIYEKNNNIFIKVKIEALTSLYDNYFSNDGILVWNINNYENKKQESIKWINTFFYSDYFYSSENGYRMKASVAFTNEKIYFYHLILVGEFDSNLPSYFNHKCTISLINQKQSISSKELVIGSKILDSASVGEKRGRKEMSNYYCHRLGISQSKVEKEPYFINNKIIVKFVVEAL